MLTKEALEQFKQIFKEEFQQEIDDATALDKASKLVNLYRAVFNDQFINENKNEKINVFKADIN